MKKTEEKIRSLIGDFDPSIPPPSISPVPEGVRRPKWSVMIPTFNCANYLRQTLESVLSQDLGSEQMQIEVVDDCSTKDDPEAVVKEIGKGRVDFYRKPKNEGAIPNFNTCIERSRGELVHILHGDDYILPGFYETVSKSVGEHEDCALFATRVFFVTEDGVYTGISQRLEDLEKGPSSKISAFYGSLEASDYGIRCPFQFAGNVVRRSFYEKNGGFDLRLVHTADMEMWWRATRISKSMVSPQVLAAYRCFEGNDTSKLNKTGENLRDLERVILKMAHFDQNFSLKISQINLVNKAKHQAELFRRLGDLDSLKNTQKFIDVKCPKTILQTLTMKLAIRSRIKKFFGR